jgi:hypothetical protein
MFVKPVDKATLADLTEKNPALLAEITTSAEAAVTAKFTTEIASLQAAHATEIAQYQKNDKIRAHAAKLNQVALGEELIASGASAEVAFDKLLSAGAAPAADITKADIAKVFTSTAPAAAGNGAVQTETPEGPKTQAEAVALCRKPGMTEAQATRAARNTYPLTFIGHYAQSKE